MTENEVASYKAMLDAYGVELDDGAYTPFEALSRADILLTDFHLSICPFSFWTVRWSIARTASN